VNSILILFDFNQTILNILSMKVTNIQLIEVGSDKFVLTERNDEANIDFPHANA
jgi:hypothetical protein